MVIKCKQVQEGLPYPLTVQGSPYALHLGYQAL